MTTTEAAAYCQTMTTAEILGEQLDEATRAWEAACMSCSLVPTRANHRAMHNAKRRFLRALAKRDTFAAGYPIRRVRHKEPAGKKGV